MNKPDGKKPFYSDGISAFWWSDVVALRHSRKGEPRGTSVYLKDCAEPLLLDYQHDGIVKAWQMHRSGEAVGKSAAIDLAVRYGGIDGDHHKAWVIDQMVRELTGCPTIRVTNPHGADGPFEHDALGESEEYIELIRKAREGSDGPETYDWDEGIAP